MGHTHNHVLDPIFSSRTGVFFLNTWHQRRRAGGPFAAAPALFTPEPELETPMTPMTPMAERGMEP